MKQRALWIALALALLLLAGNTGSFAQESGSGQPARAGELGTQPVSQPGTFQQMPPGAYPQPGGMPASAPSPIDGYWMNMTPQGPIMMGLQNGMFMMMGPNGQVFGQGAFVIQGQQIISTLANGQQETFDFQSDGMNLQLRDVKTGAVINYQKVQSQPGYPPQPAPSPQPVYPQSPPYPGYPGSLPGQPGVFPGQQQFPQQMPSQMPQQFPQMQPLPQQPQQPQQ